MIVATGLVFHSYFQALDLNSTASELQRVSVSNYAQVSLPFTAFSADERPTVILPKSPQSSEISESAVSDFSYFLSKELSTLQRLRDGKVQERRGLLAVRVRRIAGITGFMSNLPF